MERTERLVRALLTKERRQIRRGNNFTAFFHGLLYTVLAVIFFLFYRKFTALYLSLSTDRIERFFELNTLAFGAALLLFTLSAASKLVKRLFLADRRELFNALPVPPRALLLYALTASYLELLGASLAVSLILCYAPVTPLSGEGIYFAAFLLTALLLPLFAVLLSVFFALPARALLRLFRGRSLLFFLVTTALFAGGLFVYSLLLKGVKQLLLGDLKYFFNARVLAKIAYVCRFFVPSNLFARLLGGGNRGGSALILFLLSLLLSLFVLAVGGAFVRSALKAESGGRVRYFSRFSRRPALLSLIVKDFLGILRTPAYTLSFFSVAALMPLMVFFGMSVGLSLVRRLIGVDCSFELALLLTLLYTALTNVFCSSNVSRDGEMFFIVKALPLSPYAVFGAKLALCMLVCTAAQGASAALLAASRLVSPSLCALLFVFGLLFSFAQVCFSTRYDFAHARFPEGEGEAEAEGSVAVLLLGLLFALAVGLGMFLLRLVRTISFRPFPPAVTTFVALAACSALALCGGIVLFCGLRKAYYRFGGTR